MLFYSQKNELEDAFKSGLQINEKKITKILKSGLQQKSKIT